jgi:predicted dehydrogenase
VWASLRFTPAPVRGVAGADEVKSHTFPMAPAGLLPSEIWERFAAAVRGEGEPAVTADSVLPTMALLDAARESSRTGCAVEVGGKVEWVL